MASTLRGRSDAAEWGASVQVRTLRFIDREIERLLESGHVRRGTPHWAGRIETNLRLIGRHVDSVGGSEVLVVEQRDQTLLRFAVPGQEPQFLELGPENLSNWASQALETRLHR